MKKIITRLLALAITVAAAGAVYVASTKQVTQKQAGGPGGAGKRGGGFGGDAPVPVIGGTAKRADVPVHLDGVGTARALNTVTVRPQVEGRLMKIHFREGQTVQKGDLLAEIDPTTYKASLDQAMAKRALTETQLANAKRDADRYAKIPGVVAQKTVDTQAALVAQLEAQVKSDSAAIASAQAILDYTRVLAPISGRTGLRVVDEGNFVKSGAETGLVTITQVQPISVLFTLPQQQLMVVNRAQAAGPVAAQAVDSDGKTVLDSGSLTVVDNAVDQSTGTVRMKADFPNANLQLWPGQFVNVRLLVETLKQVVVVPTPAIQRGPTGTFVYVVGEDDRAAIRPVQVAQQGDTETVVKSGVNAGDRLVVSGFSRLQDGSRVIFGQEGGAPQPKAAPSAKADAPGGGGNFQRIRQACAADIQSHCATAGRDGMRQCLEANKAKFSAACQSAIAERDAQPKGEGKGQGGSDGGEARGKRGNAPGGAAQADPATTGATPARSVTQ